MLPLILSYYHPWIAGGGHRPGQLLKEDLRKKNDPLFIFYSSDNTENLKDYFLRPEYRDLRLLQYDGIDKPVQYTANGCARLTLTLEEFIENYSPDYCRAHNPVELYLPLIELLQKKRITFIYDEMDYWEGFSKKPWGDISHRKYQEIADGIVSVSNFLTSMHPTERKITIPNAVSAEFLAKAQMLKKDTYTIPVVIYTGAMWPDWFDWDLIIFCATHMPDIHFHLIGRWIPPPDENHGNESVIKAGVIKSMKNVRLTDEIEHADLITHIHKSNVGIIPFRVNDVTRAASPLKAYDYLACGLPIVSTMLPEIEDMPHTYLSTSYEDFIKKIYEALNIMQQDSAKLVTSNYISENLWHHRLKEFEFFVNNLLTENK